MTTPPKGKWFCDECKVRKEKEKTRKKKKRTRKTSFEFEEAGPVIPAQPHDSNRPVKRARASSLRDGVLSRSTDLNKYKPRNHGNDVFKKTYCYCDRMSYGDMVRCDDGDCEREWVSFTLGLVHFCG